MVIEENKVVEHVFNESSITKETMDDKIKEIIDNFIESEAKVCRIIKTPIRASDARNIQNGCMNYIRDAGIKGVKAVVRKDLVYLEKRKE